MTSRLVDIHVKDVRPGNEPGQIIIDLCGRIDPPLEVVDFDIKRPDDWTAEQWAAFCQELHDAINTMNEEAAAP